MGQSYIFVKMEVESKIFPVRVLSRVIKWVWVIPLFLIAVLKLWLTSHLPILAYNSQHDQLRYVRMAWEVVNFIPPFPYDQYVLMRQPGYSTFIWVSYLLGFSLRFLQEFIYIFSGFFLAWSVYSYCRKKLVVILFLPLYILATASYFANRQTLQESLYLPLTTLVVSCLIHLVNSYRDESKFVFWSIVLGLVFAWFWNTRPEGLWIVPTIAVTYLLIIWQSVKAGIVYREIFKQVGYSILYWLIPVVLVTCIFSFTTYIKYEIFQTSDLNTPGVKAAYSQLLSVSPDRGRYMVPVPKQTRKEIYAVSPTFKKLANYLENKGQAWFVYSCDSRVKICDDYAGGWFIWALRDAVVDAGQYKSAKDTEAFYWKIANEIKAACKSKKLKIGRASCRERVYSIV